MEKARFPHDRDYFGSKRRVLFAERSPEREAAYEVRVLKMSKKLFKICKNGKKCTFYPKCLCYCYVSLLKCILQHVLLHYLLFNFKKAEKINYIAEYSGNIFVNIFHNDLSFNTSSI